MVPIPDVLHRIQWDPAWRGSVFEIGYLDRVRDSVARIAFASVRLQAGPQPPLTVIDGEGTLCTIPLHRVREVWKDGAIIWQRQPGEGISSTHGSGTDD